MSLQQQCVYSAPNLLLSSCWTDPYTDTKQTLLLLLLTLEISYLTETATRTQILTVELFLNFWIVNLILYFIIKTFEGYNNRIKNKKNMKWYNTTKQICIEYPQSTTAVE